MYKASLTPKQQETLSFIRGFIIRAKEAPTIQELRQGLNLKSLRSVTQRLESLEAKGFIKRDRFKHRSISLLDSMSASPMGTVMVPVISSAGCDAMQVYAQEQYDEYLIVDKKLLYARKEIIALKAVGNSMVDAGIKNGDYVLVEVTESVSTGDRVAAVIGDMAVIKRLRISSEATILESESKNAGYAPIVMQDSSKVFGKVLSVIPMSDRNDEMHYLYEPGYEKK